VQTLIAPYFCTWGWRRSSGRTLRRREGHGSVRRGGKRRESATLYVQRSFSISPSEGRDPAHTIKHGIYAAALYGSLPQRTAVHWWAVSLNQHGAPPRHTSSTTPPLLAPPSQKPPITNNIALSNFLNLKETRASQFSSCSSCNQSFYCLTMREAAHPSAKSAADHH
jgi:hypothetical protein